MNSKKETLKKFIPPIFLSWKNKKPEKYGFLGKYQNWQEAMAASIGYNAENIIDKTRLSALKVKNGEAAYERDSVLFDKIEMSWPLLAGLLWAAKKSGNRLEIVDFGGSLGTSYFQNKKYLDDANLRWNIVEQDKIAEIGRREFADEILKFYRNDEFDNLLSERKPNLFLASSSLQYLSEPEKILEKVFAAKIPFIVIDKTPFLTAKESPSAIVVQKVPPKIYAASYPARIFGEKNFLSLFDDYELVADFDAYNGAIQPAEVGEIKYRGFIFKSLSPI